MRVLITGAAGGIGRALRQGLAGRYELLRLADRASQAPAGPGEECLTFDGEDLSAIVAACRGIDCIVHLAGIPVEPEEHAWPLILQANIVVTRNALEAARLAGVRRFVFASSNHVVGYLPRDLIADACAELRPDTIYGVSKVFGEAFGRMYADKHGLEVACLRIGSFRERPEDRRQLATWISPRDMVQLARRCIEAPAFRYVIAYGISENEGAFWSNRGLEWLGYVPQDRSADHAGALSDAPEEDPVSRRFHGGSFCTMHLTADPDRIG